jgi:hypothetical protein
MLQLTHLPLSTTDLPAAEAMHMRYRGVNYLLSESMTNNLVQDSVPSNNEQAFLPQKLCYRSSRYRANASATLPSRVNLSQRLTYRGVTY